MDQIREQIQAQIWIITISITFDNIINFNNFHQKKKKKRRERERETRSRRTIIIITEKKIRIIITTADPLPT